MSDTPSNAAGATLQDTSYFEKQRDLLVQEIANSIDSVVFNMDILNKSLNESIQIGKEFEDIGKLWSRFYSGINKEQEVEEPEN